MTGYALDVRCRRCGALTDLDTDRDGVTVESCRACGHTVPVPRRPAAAAAADAPSRGEHTEAPGRMRQRSTWALGVAVPADVAAAGSLLARAVGFEDWRSAPRGLRGYVLSAVISREVARVAAEGERDPALALLGARDALGVTRAEFKAHCERMRRWHYSERVTKRAA